MNATLAECENSTHRVRGYACDGNDESRVEQLAQTLLAERGAGRDYPQCRDSSRRPAYSPERPRSGARF